MHKKIKAADLMVGMYLQELCGSWIEHPFWRSSFVISDPKQIALIRTSKVQEVWIDTAKGLDVAAEALQAPDAAALGEARAAYDVVAEPPPAPAPVPIAEELARAAEICARSREAVASMFREARMGNSVDAVGVNQLVEEISDSVARNASALISLARLKTADDYTYMHSVAVCAMMIALARQLSMDDAKIRAAGVAGLLHDMGKALLPISVLNKPGKLTPAEFAIVRGHPELGHRLLSKGGGADPMALDVCLHHHEKTDGSGYPEGLKAVDLSLYAKMGAVCDVYDAITSNRPYKTGWDPAESMRMMGQWTNGHFDATVFQAFAESIGIYPVGSLVRLTSGHIAVVVEQSASAFTAPIVKVFFSTKSMARITPELLDLSAPGSREKISTRENPAKWNFQDLNTLWSGLPAAH